MDPELHTVSYAFDVAFQRMCEAKDDDALMAEVSNVLHHLFRLRELCRARLSSSGLYAVDTSTADLRAARAACWARNFDTHRLETGDVSPQWLLRTRDVELGSAPRYRHGHRSSYPCHQV